MHCVQEGAPRFKVLQLSDTHVDPHYREGALADCELPLCCRATSGVAAAGKRTAGRWGDYGRCDAPVALLENALQHIAKTHPVSPTLPQPGLARSARSHRTQTRNLTRSFAGLGRHLVDG